MPKFQLSVGRSYGRATGHAKVRYRGLAKNRNRLSVLAAFSNLLIGQRYQPRSGYNVR